MITVKNIPNIKYRAFGWIQDSTDLRGLCRVVALFDYNSEVNRELREKIIPKLVHEQALKEHFISQLCVPEPSIGYKDLIGSSSKPRKNSVCSGIIQATVKGQGRPFIGNWPADNFLRWAHAFGFLLYDYENDSFSISDSGKELSLARGTGKKLSDEEIALLTRAALAYPPAVRILSLLTEQEALSKFELGSQLGFIGEPGFTNQDQAMYLRCLASTEEVSEQKKIRQNWEGSSDKYARTIASWLKQLQLVCQIRKSISTSTTTGIYSEDITAYKITDKGAIALKNSRGNSRHAMISKNICYEFFCPRVGARSPSSDREYIRTRRACIAAFLQKRRLKFFTVDDVKVYLLQEGFTDSAQTIYDDLCGFIRIGFDIEKDEANSVTQFRFTDKFCDFILPRPVALQKSTATEEKELLRASLHCLPHDYLVLMDLAYDQKQNRQFEIETMKLFTEVYGFEGKHLGGSRKPDGALYTMSYGSKYGIIVDTKAYSSGYHMSTSQKDEMCRYISENSQRDSKVNPNEWWKVFPDAIAEFFFMFVAGEFKGNISQNLQDINLRSKISGTALPVKEMLLFGERILQKQADLASLKKEMFKNEIFLCFNN